MFSVQVCALPKIMHYTSTLMFRPMLPLLFVSILSLLNFQNISLPIVITIVMSTPVKTQQLAVLEVSTSRGPLGRQFGR